MKKYIEVKVSYLKTMENDMQKRVNESYLIDALTFTEAEARFTKYFTPFANEFTVFAVRKSSIDEVIFSNHKDDDKFYLVKAYFMAIDEKNGSEKKTPYVWMVQSKSLTNAIRSFEEFMKESMADYTLHAVQETSFLDIIGWDEPDTKE